MKKLILIGSLVILSGLIFAQTVRNASNEAELLAGYTESVNGDIINITNNIVVAAQVILSKSITFNGNGYEITVPRPGLDDMGRYNTSPSTYRVFYISGANVTINDLGIKGGSTSGSATQGGAIYIRDNAYLTMNRCIVSSSRSSSGGGGIAVYGRLYMNGSYVRRNAANYGGGLLISGETAAAYVDGSSLIENRSTSTSGGGGGAEVKTGGFIYFNNSTLANNQSTEIGGAINCAQGNVYFINSSATGNVAFGSYKGGAIGNNGGNVYILNSLLAHNYSRSSGTVANPSAYVLDDVVAYTGFYPTSQSAVRMYYSIYHATLPDGMGTTLNNVNYSGASNGSNNTIFSGGILSKITDNDGNEIGAAVFRPFLYNDQGGVAPTLKPGSFVSQEANLGTRTRFANNNNVNPAIAYYHSGSYVNLTGTSQAGQEVLVDQVNASREDPPARGAIETELDLTLYILKVNGATGGTVNGGTIYGDVYPDGTSVTVTAIPNSGQTFVRWDYVAGGVGTASTNNPYTFDLTGNVTLIPVFQASSAGEYSITYIGNGNTSGTPPVTQNYTAATEISDQGSLLREDHIFLNWNTNSNGSGVTYIPESTYSAGVNVTLYAQWKELDDDSPLPVVLSSFTAILTVQNYVKIQWVTQSETEMSGYNVYRSINPDIQSALLISPLVAANNQSTQQIYQFIDSEVYDPGMYYYWLECREFDGSDSFYGPVLVEFQPNNPGEIVTPPPLKTELMYAIPNPFNPVTNFRYSLQEAGTVNFSIYNSKGQFIRKFQTSHTESGVYSLSWDGRDHKGSPLCSGVYLIKMSVGKNNYTIKAMLSK